LPICKYCSIESIKYTIYLIYKYNMIINQIIPWSILNTSFWVVLESNTTSYLLSTIWLTSYTLIVSH
jgi:hypothetical protein